MNIVINVLAYLIFGYLMIYVLSKDVLVRNICSNAKRGEWIAVLLWPLVTVIYILYKFYKKFARTK